MESFFGAVQEDRSLLRGDGHDVDAVFFRGALESRYSAERSAIDH